MHAADCPALLSAPPPATTYHTYLTKADIEKAIAAFATGPAYSKPHIYVVPKEVSENLAAIFNDTVGFPPGATVTVTRTPERPPRQEPLFAIPEPAVPCGWSIEWRWRESPKRYMSPAIAACYKRPTDFSWQHHGTYRSQILLKKALRRLRYSDHYGRRQYCVRPTLWDFKGDIQFLGPPEGKSCCCPSALTMNQKCPIHGTMLPPKPAKIACTCSKTAGDDPSCPYHHVPAYGWYV